MILGILDVSSTMIVTAFGVVIVILVIMLQTSLGNLAATVIILLYKHHKIGDSIEASGAIGAVQEPQILGRFYWPRRESPRASQW